MLPEHLGRQQELADYWENEFDWRKPEAKINSYHNYKLEVNGIDVHFIHERSSDPGAIPLIFTHGWPGSFMEVLKIIGPLTQTGRLLLQVQPDSINLFGPVTPRDNLACFTCIC